VWPIHDKGTEYTDTVPHLTAKHTSLKYASLGLKLSVSVTPSSAVVHNVSFDPTMGYWVVQMNIVEEHILHRVDIKSNRMSVQACVIADLSYYLNPSRLTIGTDDFDLSRLPLKVTGNPHSLLRIKTTQCNPQDLSMLVPTTTNTGAVGTSLLLMDKGLKVWRSVTWKKGDGVYIKDYISLDTHLIVLLSTGSIFTYENGLSLPISASINGAVNGVVITDLSSKYCSGYPGDQESFFAFSRLYNANNRFIYNTLDRGRSWRSLDLGRSYAVYAALPVLGRTIGALLVSESGHGSPEFIISIENSLDGTPYVSKRHQWTEATLHLGGKGRMPVSASPSMVFSTTGSNSLIVWGEVLLMSPNGGINFGEVKLFHATGSTASLNTGEYILDVLVSLSDGSIAAITSDLNVFKGFPFLLYLVKVPSSGLNPKTLSGIMFNHQGSLQGVIPPTNPLSPNATVATFILYNDVEMYSNGDFACPYTSLSSSIERHYFVDMYESVNFTTKTLISEVRSNKVVYPGGISVIYTNPEILAVEETPTNRSSHEQLTVCHPHPCSIVQKSTTVKESEYLKSLPRRERIYAASKNNDLTVTPFSSSVKCRTAGFTSQVQVGCPVDRHIRLSSVSEGNRQPFKNYVFYSLSSSLLLDYRCI
jgi:hypothetical protein